MRSLSRNTDQGHRIMIAEQRIFAQNRRVAGSQTIETATRHVKRENKTSGNDSDSSQWKKMTNALLGSCSDTEFTALLFAGKAIVGISERISELLLSSGIVGSSSLHRQPPRTREYSTGDMAFISMSFYALCARGERATGGEESDCILSDTTRRVFFFLRKREVV